MDVTLAELSLASSKAVKWSLLDVTIASFHEYACFDVTIDAIMTLIFPVSPLLFVPSTHSMAKSRAWRKANRLRRVVVTSKHEAPLLAMAYRMPWNDLRRALNRRMHRDSGQSSVIIFKDGMDLVSLGPCLNSYEV